VGVAGVSANLPTVAPLVTAASFGPQKQASSSLTNYEISKTIEHIIKSPSSIKGISVAVVVDGSYRQVTASDGTTTREYVPRTEEEMEKYRRMVLAAVGNSSAQNVEVINVPLDTSTVEREREAAAAAQIAQQRDLYFALGKGVVTVVMLAIMFLLIRYILRRMAPALPLPPEGERAARLEMVAREREKAEAGVQDMVDTRPDDVAALLKVWLKEEK
jgi:flagellar M-ring protein FliF